MHAPSLQGTLFNERSTDTAGLLGALVNIQFRLKIAFITICIAVGGIQSGGAARADRLLQYLANGGMQAGNIFGV